MSAIDELVKLLKRSNKNAGSDYSGIVTKVENGVAYVQLAGSEITDTPAALSIDAKPGDKVRVRVCNGKAWITGNDTLPPSNDKKEVATKMSRDMGNRDKHIIIRDGIMKFIANTLCVDSKNFKLDENGNAEFSGMLKAAGGTFSGMLNAAGGTFSGMLDAVGGTFSGTVKGATYVDSTSNFTMDIGTSESSSGEVSPAFKIGGYINGNPKNDYLEVEITLMPKSTGNDLPHLYISGMVKKNPEDKNPYGVSIEVGNGGIDFYGSWVENNRPYRVVTSLPWSFHP